MATGSICTPPLELLVAGLIHCGGGRVVLVPFRHQPSVGRDGSAAAERATSADAGGTADVAAILCQLSGSGMPGVHLPTIWAACAPQANPLAAGMREIGRQVGAVLSGVPPGDNARVVSQGRSFAARSYRRSV